MSDADLLDLLQILETVTEGLLTESEHVGAINYYKTACVMISSFRTAIHQRMAEKAREV